MGSRLPGIVLVGFVAVSFTVSRAGAQFIYTDTNGDGVNTWADSLNSSGPTAVDIWIDSGANRDGSPGGCASPGLVSFSLILKAIGGTINWGTFTSASGGGPPAVSTPTEYHIAVAGSGGPSTPLGAYRLGTLNVEIASGSPCLDFATSTTMSPRHSTSYGAGCPGAKSDHTNRLGQGWSDHDGMTGLPSSPPAVSAPGMVLPKFMDPVVVDVNASPANCGPVSSLVANLSALPAGHDAVFTPQTGNLAGTLTWQPTAMDHGDFLVTFTAAGKNPNATSSRTTVIRLVTNPVAVEEGQGRWSLALWQNRPNPFNPATTFVFSVPERTHVRLAVYDVSGREVTRLVDRVEPAGRHEVHWPGEGAGGRPLASGVYLYKLTTSVGTLSGRLVIAR